MLRGERSRGVALRRSAYLPATDIHDLGKYPAANVLTEFPLVADWRYAASRVGSAAMLVGSCSLGRATENLLYGWHL